MWSLSLVMSEWAWSWSREQFLHCGLRKFRHSKSSVYRWYPQLARGQFVYDTYRTMKATRSRHGWVHMFITHRSTVTLQLHNFHLFRTCRTSIVSTLLHGNWQDFNWQDINWHDASCSPLAVAELLVLFCWPTPPWCPHREWPWSNFAEIFGIRKRVPGLSCGVVCVIYI